MHRRIPHGHQTRPNTKQSTVLIIILSDRHSLGWARGGHKGGRAVGGPVQLRAKNRRGTASPANLPRLHGCLPRRLMISHNYIMILSAQGGRGREWVQQGPCLPTAPTMARNQKNRCSRTGRVVRGPRRPFRAPRHSQPHTHAAHTLGSMWERGEASGALGAMGTGAAMGHGRWLSPPAKPPGSPNEGPGRVDLPLTVPPGEDSTGPTPPAHTHVTNV
jgi:hypothetical protein